MSEQYIKEQTIKALAEDILDGLDVVTTMNTLDFDLLLDRCNELPGYPELLQCVAIHKEGAGNELAECYLKQAKELVEMHYDDYIDQCKQNAAESRL